MFNFSSPKSLADFLIKVGNDRDTYNSYFEWKKNYFSRYLNYGITYLCDLCEKLNYPSIPKYYSKSQLIDWYYKSANCQNNLKFNF